MKLTAESTVLDDKKICDSFATLQVDADGIRTEVSRKVGNDEVISRINQSPESIQIQANKVDITGTAVFNAVNADASAKSAMLNSEIEVGGRNIFQNSVFNGITTTPQTNQGKWGGVSNSQIYTATIDGRTVLTANKGTSDNLICQTTTLEYTAGDTVQAVITAEIYVEEAGTLGVGAWVSSSGWKGIQKSISGNRSLAVGWNKIELLSTLENSSYSGNVIYSFGYTGATLWLYHPKLEKGNKSTDWTPASEDVQAEIDAKKNVHTLLSGTDGAQYSTILGYAKEGTSTNFVINTTSTPITNVKIGDSVRLGYYVSNMGTAGNRPLVYINGIVTAIPDATHVTITGHGLDTTIIDGGNILTDSIGANQIAANSIGARHLTVSDNTNLVTSNEMTEISLQNELTSAEPLISGGYLVKKNASQANLMLTNYVVNNFKQNDEFYFECYVKAATAGDISIAIWGYDDSNAYVSGSYVNKKISATTSEQFFSGTFKVGNAVWTNTVRRYSIGFADDKSTKSQIYVRKVIVRRKSAGELIVDGSITTDKLAANAITADELAANAVTANKIATNAVTSDKIAAGAITVGKINPVVYTYNNSGQGTGYAKLCTISVTESFRNKPIQFTLQSRNKNPTAVSWRFLNSSTPSTCAVASATYNGDTVLYYVGTGGTYTIYFGLGENYDEVKIYDLIMPYNTGLTVTWAGEYYGTSLPSGAVEFTKLAGSRTSADLDNAAKTATSYITDIDTNKGITVKPLNSSGNDYLQMNSTDIRFVRNNVDVMNLTDSSFRVGKQAGNHVDITSTAISMSEGSKTLYEVVNASSGIVKATRIYNVTVTPNTPDFTDTIELGRTVGSWVSQGIILNYKLNGTAQTAVKWNTLPINVTSGNYVFKASLSGTTISITWSCTTPTTVEKLTLTSLEFNFNTSQQVAESTLGAYADKTQSGAFRVGKGTADNAKANAMLLDWGGTARLSGDVVVNCDANSSGGLSLSRPTYAGGLWYEDSHGVVDIEAYRVGKVVMMYIYCDKDNSTSAGGTVYGVSLAGTGIPVPFRSGNGMSITGATYYNKSVIVCSLERDTESGSASDPISQCKLYIKNASTSAVTLTGAINCSLTYICE